MPGRSCKIDVVLNYISEPWTLAVIHQLSIGPRRTVELHGSFAGLSTKTLGARLKKLERGGIVARKSFSETPPRVEYSLTAKGRAILRILDVIAEVAEEWKSEGWSSEDIYFGGEGKEAASICRACRRDEAVAAKEEESAEPVATPAKPRKRTDVTLL